MNSYTRYTSQRLMEIYTQLQGALGENQQWWSARSPLEIIIGAILTQNTAWSNVEKALARLAEQNLLPTPDGETTQDGISSNEAGKALLTLPEETLAEYIYPAGFYRLKARRLRSVLAFLDDICEFDLDGLARSLRHDDVSLRRALLKIGGIGPETADNILLYALKRPSFVVDTYTMRLFSRHRLLPMNATHENVRAMFMDALPPSVELYSNFHACIVRACKTWCRKKHPRCPECPLGKGLWTWENAYVERLSAVTMNALMDLG